MNFGLRLDELVRNAYSGEISWIYDQLDGTSFIGESLKGVEENIIDTKQAITSLIKELVADAKPYRETINDKWNKDRVDEVKATNAAMNAWADIYEQNLLKALEEV